MKIISRDIFMILVPTEKEFLCSIKDKERFDRETENENKKEEHERKEVSPIYMFKEAFIPSSRTIESCEEEFMEIDSLLSNI